MTAFDDALVDLFAANLESDVAPETTPAYAVLADRCGREALAPTRELLSIWRANFRKQRAEAAQAQVRYCLVAIGRAARLEQRRLVQALALRIFGPGWSDAQREHFEQLADVFAEGYDFFLSFTGRNPTHGQAVLRVNREYEAFIARVLTPDRRARADAASDNLLAGALHALLRADHRLTGFYYPDRQGDSADVKKKLDEGCRRSLAFVQLLDNEMLLPQDAANENYCYWEYKRAEQGGLEILFLFPYAKRDELLALEDRAEEVADWYDRVSTADLRLLPLARDSDPVKLQNMMDQIRSLAEQIRAARRERLARIPA